MTSSPTLKANDMETNYEFAGYLSEITAYLLRGQSAVDLLASDEEDRMDEESAYAIFRNIAYGYGCYF